MPQHADKLGLHGGKLVLRRARSRRPVPRADDAARILGALAEANHVPGQARHRADQERIEGEIDETRGEQRNQDRQPEDIEPVRMIATFSGVSS